MGILDQVAGMLRVLPGGQLTAQLVAEAGRRMAAAEQVALRLLADRLLAASTGTRAGGPAALGPPARQATGTSPSALLDDLLARAMRGTTDSAQEEHHLTVLRQLVPDEARIFATLATGTPSPTVSVLRRGSGEPVLRNASLIGRTAAVTVPSRTPAYVSHLLRLGLVELGPEDAAQASGYELVLAERDVRDALVAGQLGKLPARVVRGTVRVSPAGRELWAAARPERP